MGIHIGHVYDEHEVVDYASQCHVQDELDHDVGLARSRLELRRGGLPLAICGGFLRARGGDIGGEGVFEEGLPEDVRRRAYDGEDGEFDERVEVEGDGCLDGFVVSYSCRDKAVWEGAEGLTTFLYADIICASRFENMLSAVLCAVGETRSEGMM